MEEEEEDKLTHNEVLSLADVVVWPAVTVSTQIYVIFVKWRQRLAINLTSRTVRGQDTNKQT